MANPVISGIVRDRNRNVITGVQCNIDVYDKDDRSLRIGSSKSKAVNGEWYTELPGIPHNTKVLTMFSLQNSQFIAGAEFMQATTTTSTSTSTTTSTSTSTTTTTTSTSTSTSTTTTSTSTSTSTTSTTSTSTTSTISTSTTITTSSSTTSISTTSTTSTSTTSGSTTSANGEAECDCDTRILAFDDESTPDTINQDDSITIFLNDGCPPYEWSVEGTGFSMTLAQTQDKNNTLNASPTACGPASITITDHCERTVYAYIRCTTGSWTVSYVEYLHQPWTVGYCLFDNLNCSGCDGEPLTYEEIYGKYKFVLEGPICLASYQPSCGGSGSCPNDFEWKQTNGDPPTAIPHAGDPNQCHVAYHGGTCTCDPPSCYDPVKGCIYRYAKRYDWIC